MKVHFLRCLTRSYNGAWVLAQLGVVCCLILFAQFSQCDFSHFATYEPSNYGELLSASLYFARRLLFVEPYSIHDRSALFMGASAYSADET